MPEDDGAERLRAGEVGEGGGGLGGEEGAEELDIGAGSQDTGSDSGCSHWLTSV